METVQSIKGGATDTNVFPDGSKFGSSNEFLQLFHPLSHFSFVTWQGAVTTAGLMSLDCVHAVGGEEGRARTKIKI